MVIELTSNHRDWNSLVYINIEEDFAMKFYISFKGGNVFIMDRNVIKIKTI